jgi:Rrf2 family protein
MILSRACEYAIQALLFLREQPPERFVPVKEIASRTGISESFLAKVLGQLVAHRLLASLKGPRGGVRMVKQAKEMTVIEVVAAIDGLGFLRQCVIGLPHCGSDAPCPLHAVWAGLREKIVAMLSARTLVEIKRHPRRRARRSVRRKSPSRRARGGG